MLTHTLHQSNLPCYCPLHQEGEPGSAACRTVTVQEVLGIPSSYSEATPISLLCSLPLPHCCITAWFSLSSLGDPCLHTRPPPIPRSQVAPDPYPQHAVSLFRCLQDETGLAQVTVQTPLLLLPSPDTPQAQSAQGHQDQQGQHRTQNQRQMGIYFWLLRRNLSG